MTRDANQYHKNGAVIIVLSISLGLFLVSLTNNFIHFMNSVSAQLLTQNGQQSSNSATRLCTGDGFSVYYPSDWTRFNNVQQCTLFSPDNREIFPNPAADTYVRITPAYNLSRPTSIDNLTRDITYFADGNIYHLINPPWYPHNLNVPNAVELDYEWNRSTAMFGAPQVALPYVSQFTTPTPTSPIMLSSAINTPLALNPSPGQTPPLNRTGVIPSPQVIGPTKVKNTPNQTGAPPATYNEMTAAIYFINGNKVYVFEYTAPTENFEASLSKATEMANSFEISPARRAQ